MLSAAMATAQAARSSRDLNSRIIVEGRIYLRAYTRRGPDGGEEGERSHSFPIFLLPGHHPHEEPRNASRDRSNGCAFLTTSDCADSCADPRGRRNDQSFFLP